LEKPRALAVYTVEMGFVKDWFARREAGGARSCYVYIVERPDGTRDNAVSLLASDVVAQHGLVPEVIMGRCDRFEADEKICPENFEPNPLFIDLLHDVVAREADRLPNVIAAAQQQQHGFILMLDMRTLMHPGTIPSLVDIIGQFAVRDGVIVPESYRRNDDHLLFSDDGLFQLDDELDGKLMDRLTQRVMAKRAIGRP